MSDPAILFVKPKAISVKDKKALQGAGVIVVEVDDPSSVKLVRAHSELSSGALLSAAAAAIQNGNWNVKNAFAEAICAAISLRPTP